MELKSLSQRIEYARMKSWCLGMIKECLGCLLHAPRGLLYSPKAARSRWRQSGKAILAFYQVAHRTVQCTTEHALFMVRCRSPSKNGIADRCRVVAVGTPDNVWCTPDSPVPPADRWSEPHVARGFSGRPLLWRPLAHRTVRCTNGQSGAPPDSPVHHRTVR
jgi:hypothetical protein